MNRGAVLLLVVAALGSGCAKLGRSPENFPAPSTGRVTAQVSAANASVKSGKVNIGNARTAIGHAQESARKIELLAGADLRPEVEALSFRLSQADVELRQANDRADEALSALTKSEEASAFLQIEIDRQTATLNKVAAEKNKALDQKDKAEAQAKHQESLAWKWRKHAFGAWGLIVIALLWFFKTPILRLFGVPIP